MNKPKPTTTDEFQTLLPSEEGQVQYVVLNEHTLGYLYTRDQTMGVLHGSVLKGGHDWKNGDVSIVLGSDHLRKATVEDFNEYRVVVPSNFYPEPASDSAKINERTAPRP